MPSADHLAVLTQRYLWLIERIKAKEEVGWETHWDERERDSLGWALDQLCPTSADSLVVGGMEQSGSSSAP